MAASEGLFSHLPNQLRPRSVAINSLFLFSFQITTTILALISSISLANHYNTQLFGQYYIGFSVAALCAPFADLGLELFFQREIAQKKSSDLHNQFGVILVTKLTIGLFPTLLIYEDEDKTRHYSFTKLGTVLNRKTSIRKIVRRRGYMDSTIKGNS